MSAQLANAEKEAGNQDYQNGDFESALRHYTAAIQLDPTNHIHHSNRSACFFSMNQLHEAVQDSVECIRLKPDWPRGYVRKGKALFELKKYKEAAAAFKSGLDLDPSNEALQVGKKAADDKITDKSKGSSLSDMFTPEKVAKLRTNPKTAAFFAQPDFLQIVDRAQRNPESTAGLMLDPRVMACFQANMEMELENIKSGAFAGLDDILKSSPVGDFISKNQIPKPGETGPGLRKEPEDAKTTAPRTTVPGKYMNKGPEESKAPKHRTPPQDQSREAEEAKTQGNEAYKDRNFEEAIRLYDRAITLNPGEIVYYTNKAAVLLETKEYAQCAQVCDQGIAKGRENRAEGAKIAKALGRKGTALRKLNDHENALDCFRAALVLQPDATTSQQIAELEKIVASKKSAQRAEPKKQQPTHHPEPKKQQPTHHPEPKKQTHKADNKKQTQPAQSRNPVPAATDPNAQQPYQEPTTLSGHAEQANAEGTIAYKNQFYSEAEQKYSEAIDLNPRESKYWANRSAARIKEGNLSGALRDVDKSLEIDPTMVKAWNRKGGIHQSQHNLEKALEAYDQALTLDVGNEEALDGFANCANGLYLQLSTSAGNPAVAEALRQEDVMRALGRDEAAKTAIGSQETREKVKELLRSAGR